MFITNIPSAARSIFRTPFPVSWNTKHTRVILREARINVSIGCIHGQEVLYRDFRDVRDLLVPNTSHQSDIPTLAIASERERREKIVGPVLSIWDIEYKFTGLE